MNKNKIALVLGAMCFALTIAIAVQCRTISNANKLTGSTVNDELKTEVLRWKEKYETSYEELEELDEILEERRDLATSNDESSTKIQEQLTTLNSLIGVTDVNGKGIVITLADNETVTSQNVGVYDNISNYLIHDSDLNRLINELKNAGAEAISINDERIISTTSITCDGNVILINGNKVGSPFTIKAIGSQELMLGAIQRPGGLLDNELIRYGLVKNIVKEDKITIYKYSGVID